MSSRKQFHHLTYVQRLQLEAYLKTKISKSKIARLLGVHVSTIYREISRGEFSQVEYKYGYYEKIPVRRVRYSPDIAWEKYRGNLSAKGPGLKIGKDFYLAFYIEDKILNEGYSPAAVLAEIKNTGLSFETSFCVNTLYSYIKKGVFDRLTFQNISGKNTTRKKHRKVYSRPPRGTSIEKRPSEIFERKSFGHWEMDCVIGKRETRDVLLVLTERLTRFEIIERLPNKKPETVVRCLDSLERRYGRRFTQIFKSITVDNGVEFSDSVGLERSQYGNRTRTKVYYCHPFCSSERGSNERMNREIRRKFPKGTSFTNIPKSEIKKVESWLNNYPRKILDYRTSADLFKRNLAFL